MHPIPSFSLRTIILFIILTYMVSIPVFGDNPTLSPDALQCMDCQKNCNAQYPLPTESNYFAWVTWGTCINDCAKAFPGCPPVTIPPSPKPTTKPIHIITGISILKTKEPQHVITGVIKNFTTLVILKKPLTLSNIFPASIPTTSTSETNILCKNTTYANSHWTQCTFCKNSANAGTLACTLCKQSPEIMMCGDYCKETANPNCIVTPTPTGNSLYPKVILNPCQTLSYANSHPDECLLKVISPILSLTFTPSAPPTTPNGQSGFIHANVNDKSDRSVVDNSASDGFIHATVNTETDRSIAGNSGSNSLVIKSLITPAVMVNPISNNPDLRSVSDQSGSSSGSGSQITSNLIKGPSFLSNVSNTSTSINQSINLTNLSVTKTKVVKK